MAESINQIFKPFVPPSLLNTAEGKESDTDFNVLVASCVNNGGKVIDVVEGLRALQKLMLMTSFGSNEGAENILKIVRRRAILLALVKQNVDNLKLMRPFMDTGYLGQVKGWLDDVFKLELVGIDFLLHILDSIMHLPVSRDNLQTSKMGREVNFKNMEKRDFIRSADESNKKAIESRCTTILTQWKESIRKHGVQDKEGKRNNESVSMQQSKRAKTEVLKASDLLRKGRSEDIINKKSGVLAANQNWEAANKASKSLSAAEVARLKAKERISKSHTAVDPRSISEQLGDGGVKWADEQENSMVSMVTVYEYEDEDSYLPKKSSKKGTWLEQKKEEHLREKELMRNAKLAEREQEQVLLDGMGLTTQWQLPPILILSNTPGQADSNEVSRQNERMSTVKSVSISSESHIPLNPSPLSNVEVALDIASRTSTTVNQIPFFESKSATSDVPTTTITNSVSEIAAAAQKTLETVATQASFVNQHGLATEATVQALGLPPFLAGYDVQALQTLVNSPMLLHTFLDERGQYNEAALKNLVQGISQTLEIQTKSALNAQSHPNQTFGSSFPTPIYGSASKPSQASYVGNEDSFGYNGSTTKPATGYRGSQNDDGNLHVKGYGFNTTEADLMALFSSYVQVDEIVMKPNFSFVNTCDPVGAKRAMDSLQGTMINGRPIRINLATRRATDPSKVGAGFPVSGGFGFQRPTPFPSISKSQVPTTSLDQGNYDSVYDDRGNIATKNLFVSGYGPSTGEQDLYNLFSQYGRIKNVVMKPKFAFVNTESKGVAVNARTGLSGQIFNGGPLRINFAKESGRLGTSFDNKQSDPVHQQQVSHQFNQAHTSYGTTSTNRW